MGKVGTAECQSCYQRFPKTEMSKEKRESGSSGTSFSFGKSGTKGMRVHSGRKYYRSVWVCSSCSSWGFFRLLPWVVLFSAILWLFPIVGTNTFSFDRGSKTGFDDSQNLSSKMTEEEKDLSKLHSILELQKEGWKFANKIPIEKFMEVYPNWNKMNGQARASALRVYGIQKNQ